MFRQLFTEGGRETYFSNGHMLQPQYWVVCFMHYLEHDAYHAILAV